MIPYFIPKEQSSSHSQRSSRLHEANPYVGNFGYDDVQHKEFKPNSLPNAMSFSGTIRKTTHRDRLAKDIPYFGTFRHAPEEPFPILKSEGFRDILCDPATGARGRGFLKRPIMTQVQISRENRFSSRHFAEADLEAIPIIMYDETMNVNAEESEKSCAICLEIFHSQEELRLLSCEHKFHRKCIDRWLLGRYSGMDCHTNTCPICKCVPQLEPFSQKDMVCTDIPSDSFIRVGAALLKSASATKSVKMEASKPTALSMTARPRGLDSAVTTTNSARRRGMDSTVSKVREDGLKIMMMLLDAAQDDDDQEE